MISHHALGTAERTLLLSKVMIISCLLLDLPADNPKVYQEHLAALLLATLASAHVFSFMTHGQVENMIDGASKQLAIA